MPHTIAEQGEGPVTDPYFVSCRRGETKGKYLTVLPAGNHDLWEVWEACGNATGSAELIRAEENDLVYRGNWYRRVFIGERFDNEIVADNGQIWELS